MSRAIAAALALANSRPASAGRGRSAGDRSVLGCLLGAAQMRPDVDLARPIWRRCQVASLCIKATRGRNITMRKNFSIALTLLALAGAAPLLGACHTTAGAGQDISASGHVLTNSAQKNTP
jgi:predicted small secreted protein